MASTRTTDIFIVKLSDKGIDSERTRIFLRTETGRISEITGCSPITNRHLDDCNGLVLNAKQISAQYLADLLAATSDSASLSGTTSNEIQRYSSKRSALED